MFQDSLRSVRDLVVEICSQDKQAELLVKLDEVEKREYFTKEEVLNYEKGRKIASKEDVKAAVVESENKIKENSDGNKEDVKAAIFESERKIKEHCH